MWPALAFVLVWSSGYIVGALATQVAPPLAVTLWRFLHRRGRARVHRPLCGGSAGRAAGSRRSYAAVGVPLFAIQFGALYTALADGMPAATTSLIACSSPLLVAVISACARWDGRVPCSWAGIGLGVVGVAVTLADRVGRPPNAGALVWTLLGLASLAVGTVLHSRVQFGRRAGVRRRPNWSRRSPCWASGHRCAAASPSRSPGTRWARSHGWPLVTGVGAPLLLFALSAARARPAPAACSSPCLP